MQQPGLNQRRRERTRQISSKRGNIRIGTLRQTYGASFAPGVPDDAKLSDVLHRIDELSLTKLVREHSGGRRGTARRMSGEPRMGQRTAQEISPRWDPGSEAEAAELLAAAARNLLTLVNDTLVSVRQAREETRGALDNLEASLALSHVRGETRSALDNLEAQLALSPPWLERMVIHSPHHGGATMLIEELPNPAKQPIKPAVPIRRSVHPDYLVCLEDGKKLKMLKRYLRSKYGLTPAEYRAKWGLSPDYPMVAPSYAKQRSAMAKQIRLGNRYPRRKSKSAAVR